MLKKQDYRLEKLYLHKYNAIRNMGVVAMLAASFCARLPKNLVIMLLFLAKQLPRDRLRDIRAINFCVFVKGIISG